MKYGLSEKQLAQIIGILSGFDQIDEAVLFGSRAIDTYKEASDVVIAIKGKKVTAGLAAKLKFIFEEDTYLPFFFDFIAYPTITNKKLKEHIDRKGVTIYRKGKGGKSSEHDLQDYRMDMIKEMKTEEDIHGNPAIPESCSRQGEGEAGMSEWKETVLDEIALINPTESLVKGSLAKKVAMEQIIPFTKRVSGYTLEPFNGGMKFRNGDTIIARITPCLENGKTAYIDILDNNEIGFGSTEYIVLRQREGISDKQFLYYFAISDEFRDVAILAMTGSSGRQRVETDVVRNHRFFLPPLPEQKAIASVLSSLDDKIDLLNRQNKTLEAMAEALFRQWFVEPCKDGLPEGWREGKMPDEFDFVMGSSPPGESYNENGVGIPMFQGNADFGFRFPKERVFTTAPVRFAEKHDTLISVRAPVGAQNMAHKKCCIGRGVAAFNYKYQKDLYTYTYFKMKSLMTEIERFNDTGTVFGAISKADIEALDLAIPPISLVLKFEEASKPIDLKVINNCQQIESLENLRDTLLPKLISGEVRVSV